MKKNASPNQTGAAAFHDAGTVRGATRGPGTGARKKEIMTMEDRNQMRQRLKELLLQKSYREGKIRLSSGRESDFYIDGKETTLDAEGAYLCGMLLYDLIISGPTPLGGVGGMTLGADPLVTAVSIVSYLQGRPLPAFIVRKEPKGHGTENYIEGKGNLAPGTSVALLEDVVTTGSTLLQVIERVRSQGFAIGLVATVVDREEGGREALAAAGYELLSVFTRRELLAP
jgi:orotate phosphoribosyltransferase